MMSNFAFDTKVVVVVMGFFLSFSFTQGGDVDLQESKSILLEAKYSSRGMWSWRDGSHLIARVYNDGAVEYEDIELKNGVSSSYLRRTMLSNEELNGLSELLRSTDIQGLSSKYAAHSTTIDHSEDLLLTIKSGTTVKEVKVENFKPDLPEARAKYPKALLRVACWAEVARKNAQVRFFFRETIACCK